MMSAREQIQQEIYDSVNENDNRQEEVDMEDRPAPIYDYKSPNHKPPFKNGEDYTELMAEEDEEINAIAFGKGGKYLKLITENNGMAYIYHNRVSNKIELWGESRKFDKVIDSIKKRYENARNYLDMKKEKCVEEKKNE